MVLFYKEEFMSLSINYNQSNSNIVSATNFIYQNMMSSMEKLSSGYKINHASDGPAQLVISEQLRTQIGSLSQKIENTNMQIAKYNTGSSYVSEMRSSLNDLRSLAVGAANEGINSESAQQAFDSAAQSLVGTYNDKIDNVEYNGYKLLNGDEGSLADISALEGIDMSSPEAAEASIEIIDNAISELDSAQVEIGSTQKNELTSARASMEITRQNLLAAESQIRDTDIVREYSNFMSQQIKLKMSTALMAHSFIQANTVLSLTK